MEKLTKSQAKRIAVQKGLSLDALQEPTAGSSVDCIESTNYTKEVVEKKLAELKAEFKHEFAAAEKSNAASFAVLHTAFDRVKEDVADIRLQLICAQALVAGLVAVMIFLLHKLSGS